MKIAELIKEFDKEHITKNVILIGEDEAIRNISIKNEDILKDES